MYNIFISKELPIQAFEQTHENYEGCFFSQKCFQMITYKTFFFKDED